MRTRFSLAMLSSARVLSSVILAGKRDFRLHSTSSFSEYVVVAKLLSMKLSWVLLFREYEKKRLKVACRRRPRSQVSLWQSRGLKGPAKRHLKS